MSIRRIRQAFASASRRIYIEDRNNRNAVTWQTQQIVTTLVATSMADENPKKKMMEQVMDLWFETGDEKEFREAHAKAEDRVMAGSYESLMSFMGAPPVPMQIDSPLTGGPTDPDLVLEYIDDDGPQPLD